MGFFIEIIFPTGTLKAAGFGGRDEIEDSLDDALVQAGIGEVTGAGSGSESSNLDVEIGNHVTPAAAVSQVARILRDMKVPQETRLIVRTPERRVINPYQLDDSDLNL